tara:strand:+ start:1392 stop:2378 length:987 start_codon:yes stop_codon:yes gene_type:complete
MSELIECLPGIVLPVEEVTRRLDTMWAGDASEHSPSEFRASQMNVVLHFGREVTVDEARYRFEGLIRFAQRYPSRIIVLCPRHSGDGAMHAKLFSQCYIGSTHREMCCCEALLLSYQPEDSGFLSNQVSTWLESDLPTYHWFSGVPRKRIEGYFGNLLSGVRRCVYDSSIESENLSDLDWPHRARVFDLAAARILPLRQSIGQYLSAYPLETLGNGLESIAIRYIPSLCGEATALRNWVRACLETLYAGLGTDEALPEIELFEAECEAGVYCLEMNWLYSNDNHLHWHMFVAGAHGLIETRFSGREERLPTHIRMLPLENTLAEALFF